MPLHLLCLVESEMRVADAGSARNPLPQYRLVGGFVREHESLFDARIAAGRVVDAHGDLRPEFYRRSRALVRVLTCAWHLRDQPLGAAAGPWRERACWYRDAATAPAAPATSRRAVL